MAAAPSVQDGIVILDSLTIQTTQGAGAVEKTINLCAGDLSRIPQSWGVDILLISAFRGDYTATPSSVVGALSNVAISVRHIAKNKAEDLRDSFHCWYSNPLQDLGIKAPFKRLMCFENSSVNVAKDVATLFRGLSTISTLGDNLKVMSSLLKTGDSGNNMRQMLQAMVFSCAHWMLIGMPMKEFNIVLFRKGTDIPAKTRYKVLIDEFSGMKTHILEQVKKERESKQQLEFDLYLTYSPKEKKLADDFVSVMKSHATSLRMHVQHENLDKDATWQDDMYQKIKKSVKIVHFLSPPFLGADECIEQFNISYYLNSKVSDRVLLAPLLLDRSTDLPNYMKAIQWLDCSKYDMGKIADAANQIFKSISTKTRLPMEIKGVTVEIDVFISYAHKDTETMQKFRTTLMKLNPNLGLFVDSDKLSTGHSWQQTLYESVEASATVICLLSEDYFNSAVCREEFHLALAANLAQPVRKTLVPVLLNNKVKLPKQYDQINPLGVCKDFPNLASLISQICKDTNDSFRKKIYLGSPLFTPCQEFKHQGNLHERLSKKRENYFTANVKPTAKLIEEALSKKNLDSDMKSIAVIHHGDNVADAHSVRDFIVKMSKKKIEVIVQNDVADAGFAPIIDRADSCIALVSSKFIKDQQCISNFNLALLDARMTERDQVVVVVLEPLPDVIYPSLVCNKFVCGDDMWQKCPIAGLNARQSCFALASYSLLKRQEVQEVLPDKRSCMLINPL